MNDVEDAAWCVLRSKELRQSLLQVERRMEVFLRLAERLPDKSLETLDELINPVEELKRTIAETESKANKLLSELLLTAKWE